MAFTSAKDAFEQGGVIAYPTEGVFGLGCDPTNEQAIERLISVKSRSVEKGLILLAGDYEQLKPFINEALLPAEKKQRMLDTWPNGTTFVVPANKTLPVFLTGKFATIAVRVTNQPDVVALCAATTKPIVSTSANISGQESAITWQGLSADIVDKIDFIIKGNTLGYTKASTIVDAITGTVFRA